MAISCEPSDLTTAAKCFVCLSPEEREAVKTYLLAVIAAGSTDPEVLASAAKCFQCIPKDQLRQIQAYLLCQIANAHGGDGVGCDYQDMQIGWADAALNLGEKLGFTATVNMTGITSLTFRQAAIVNAINFQNQTALLSVDFPNLLSFAVHVDIFNCGNVASITMPSLQDIAATGGRLLIGLTGISSISLPALNSAYYIQIYNNASLTSLSIPVLIPSNGDTLNLTGNALSQASVDHVLAVCVAALGFTSGQVALTGGTNSAPSAAGLINKATLIGRGVTVTTN